MNEGIIAKAVEELRKVPIEIRDIMLVVNCRDLAGDVFAGSNIINVGSVPLYLTDDEKAIILAEIVKKLDIRVEDLASFLRSAR